MKKHAGRSAYMRCVLAWMVSLCRNSLLLYGLHTSFRSCALFFPLVCPVLISPVPCAFGISGNPFVVGNTLFYCFFSPVFSSVSTLFLLTFCVHPLIFPSKSVSIVVRYAEKCSVMPHGADFMNFSDGKCVAFFRRATVAGGICGIAGNHSVLFFRCSSISLS